MKAIVYHSYGGPEVLRCEDLPKPEPGDDEVLIRVRAASVNPMDVGLVSGVYLMRLMTGLRRPKLTRPGVDMAGEVEAVGRNVTRFKAGDSVFGAARGALAEYVTAAPERLALKPAALTFAQAAAIPVAGMTALQGLRDKLRIQPGQKVLITGASGGVGSFAVQIAKAFGAEVTALCSTRSVELVRALGADHVIDYSREDFTRSAGRYDLIFDAVGNRPLSACRRVMTPKGIFLAVGVRPGGHRIGPLPYLLKLFASRPFVRQTVVFFMARVTTDDLNALTRLIESNQVTPAVDRVYPLAEVADAFRYFKEGHPRGKVVIRVQDP